MVLVVNGFECMVMREGVGCECECCVEVWMFEIRNERVSLDPCP